MTYPAVTLETKCWQADWKLLLTTNRLEVLAERNAFPFAERVLMINNVDDYSKVVRHADRAVARGWITKYVVVRDHIDEALRFFQLTPEALGKGYVYSVAEFVSVYVCRTPFLLHYAGDSLPAERCDWIPDALELFTRDPRVRVANLTWDHKYEEAGDESVEETDDFYIGFGFSDQCWLVRTADFRAPIYNHSHPASARYPDYGGELFEKRVDAWMRTTGALRGTYKSGSYIHQRQPAPTRWERWRRRLLGGA
jgi:hypothetical protein